MTVIFVIRISFIDNIWTSPEDLFSDWQPQGQEAPSRAALPRWAQIGLISPE